jgi:hypothetical protein
MGRHTILRTSFWELEGSEALQLVWDTIPVPLQLQDWRTKNPDEQQEHLDSYLRQERMDGFDPAEIPQWRMLLTRTADDSYQLIWSAHHAIADGWSTGLLLAEVAQHYEALVLGQHPTSEPVRPYRDYVAWLENQDMQQAESYWRQTLHGIEQATPLSIERQHVGGGMPSGTSDHAEVDVLFSEEETGRLHELAQAHQLTLNTILQGCWALLLGRYAGADDVIFGAVVSGRPPEVAGVERMIGLFINILPVRVHLPEQSSSLKWLQGLQAQNVQMRQYEYSPLGQVQQWSGIPAGAPLFETLFDFENYPVEKHDAALRFEEPQSEERIHYPLGVLATVGDRLGIAIQYDTDRFEREAIERMLGHFQSICSQIARAPGVRLREITVLTEQERQQILQQWNPTPQETLADADFDLSAFAAGIGNAEERELLEQLVAEVQGMSPSDLQAQTLNASSATDASK